MFIFVDLKVVGTIPLCESGGSTMLNERYKRLLELIKQNSPLRPPLRQLAKETGFANGSSVRYAIQRLEKLGYISVQSKPKHYTEISIRSSVD